MVHGAGRQRGQEDVGRRGGDCIEGGKRRWGWWGARGSATVEGVCEVGLAACREVDKAGKVGVVVGEPDGPQGARGMGGVGYRVEGVRGRARRRRGGGRWIGAIPVFIGARIWGGGVGARVGGREGGRAGGREGG